MKFFATLLNLLFSLLLLGALGTAGLLGWAYHRIEPELPSIDALKDVRLQVPLRVYSRDGLLMAEYGEKRRIPLGYDEIPERVRLAFLAAEDDRFFEHPGVDYHGLLRAGAQLILTGERRQGGSTITMQVARNFFLSREKTFARKLKEIFLALRIERELSKPEILELYLNKIYLGSRAYGIGAAAYIYYGVKAGDLTLPQMAMLAGLPKAPSTTNPVANPERAIKRRNYVLGRMAELGYISAEELESAVHAPDDARLHAAAIEVDAPYVAEMVRADMMTRFGEDAYTLGLDAYTSIDARLQATADQALRHALQDYDSRHGYRGPVAHKELREGQPESLWQSWVAEVPAAAALRPALVTAVADRSASLFLARGERLTLDWKGLRWARKHIDEDHRGPQLQKTADVLSPGDLIYLYQDSDDEGPFWRLAQVPAAEGALVALDPTDGALRALVGGYDFNLSKFNRATQAQRQAGSGFKGFIYSAALEAGFTPASLINDAPLVMKSSGPDGDWRPENYSGEFFGPTRLRVALYNSRNLVSIRLMRAMGVDTALAHAARFGFDPAKLPRNLTLALGSGEVTVMQMARGYAVMANGGYLVDPWFVDRVEDDHDGVVYQASPLRVCSDCPQPPVPAGDLSAESPRHAPRVISAQNHYLMTSMLQDVVRRGTARRARTLGRSDLAGKTGTTNDQRDAWFNGFNPSLVAVAWVGFDSFKPLGKGEVGGKAALPAWMDFMRVALDGMPDRGWPEPEGIVTARIDPETGQRAGTGQQNAVFEVFFKDRPPEAAATSGIGLAPGSGRSGETLTQELF